MKFNDNIKKTSEDNFKLLTRYYLRNTVVPFIGSGFSASVCKDKFPQWKAFLLDYATQLNIHQKILDTLENTTIPFRYELAAAILTNHDAAFSEKIQTFFSLDETDVIKPDASVQLLPKLFPQSPVITTNLDTVIETVYRNNGNDIEQILYGSSFSAQQLNRITNNKDHVLLKIHGCVKDKNTIVFSENQYSRLYGPLDTERDYKISSNKKFPAHFKKMASDVRFLFLGCSLNEDRYLELLKQLKNHYKENANYHFAIISAPEDEEEFISRQEYLASCGIAPIWYPSGQHNLIKHYLDKLLEDKSAQISTDNKANNPDNVLDGKKLSSRFIDSIAQKAHDNNTDKNLAKAILIQSDRYNSIKKISTSILTNLCNKIANAQAGINCPLIIKGQPGTGKSTLLSIIYLNLPEPIDCYTTLIDLHCFDQVKDPVADLTNVLIQVDNGVNTHKSSILFIDGFNSYDRMNNQLEKTLMAKINQWKRKKSIHFIFAVGVLDNDQFPPFIRTKTTIPFIAEETIQLAPINTTTAEFSFLVEKVLKTLSIVPARQHSSQKNHDAQNSLLDNIITFCKRITGGIAEYRTIVFVATRYIIYKNEMFDMNSDSGNISKIFKEYFSSFMDDETLLNTADHITKFMLHKEEKPMPWTNSIVFKSPAFRDFFFALSYLNAIKKGQEEKLSLFNCIFTPSINRFIVSLMVQDINEENQIVSKLIARFPMLDIRSQTQITYLLGRVKSSTAKKSAINFLFEKYVQLKKSIAEACRDDDTDTIMLFRSISISLIYLGYKDCEDDFFFLLINNEKIRDVNLKFHIAYYTTNAYKVGEEISFDSEALYASENLENLYNYLYHCIESTDERGRQGINIITIISLAIYQQYQNRNNRKKEGFIALIEKLEKDTSITSPVLKRFIIGIKDHLQENNIYASAISKFYTMKTIQRSGWIQEGREIDKKERVESDADHTWGCCMLAHIFLTDRIDDCAFLSKDDKAKFAQKYDKNKIINLLLVHDLPEIYTGDIPFTQKSVDKKSKEATAMQKIAALDAFSQFNSFQNIASLWNEYEAKSDINAVIAYQIDKLEPLVQLYIYRAALPETQRKSQLDKWTQTAIEQLSTCKIQTSFGSKVLEFLSTYFLGNDFFEF